MEQSEKNLAEQFANNMAYDSHQVQTRFRRSDSGRALRAMGMSAVHLIIAYVEANPPSDRGAISSEEMAWCWTQLLWSIARDAGYVAANTPEIGDLEAWIAWAKNSAPKTMRIRIVDTPPGSVPEHIRNMWVGIELESQGREVVVEDESMVVVRDGLANLGGYKVDIAHALEALRTHNPEAYAWWAKRFQGVDYQGVNLVFHADVCKEIDK